MANPYFNAAYYLANNQDLVIAGVTEETAELHYDLHGAGEGRAPNSWFDAEAYLLSNTDLIPGGVTLATALQHFATYGVYEGRVFNNNPALDPANFPAAEYAEENADVAEALGIEDLENPTPEEAALLMSHFLAHGLTEGREGAGAFGDAAQIEPIEVNPPAVAVGTAGNDTFTWNVSGETEASVNGLAGDDTLQITTGVSVEATLTSVEHIEVVASADVDVDVLGKGAGVQTLKVDADGHTVTYSGAKLNSISLVAGSADLVLTGEADALEVTWGKAADVLSVDGIEQVNVAVAAEAASVAITSDELSGESLTFVLTGGEEDADLAATFDSASSANLATVTVDASGVLSNVTLDLSGSDLVNVDAVVTTGAGDDVITTGTVAGQTATVDAGAGDDEINGSAGVDTFTGGAGEDTFAFGALDNALLVLDSKGETIEAFDTITDFKAADAGVTFTALTVSAGDFSAIGEVSVEGVLSFGTGFLAGKDLFDVVTALDDVGGAANAGVLFNFEGSAYLFVSGGAEGLEDDGLIQLTGVNADLLAINGNAVVYESNVA